ncbi:hypothetical protein A2631_06075 [Candidatus Daviesbacteria bacterium RIFCSPHIGHO2_01_FULL_44_29]|uniref:Uncharacterized protein n=1 Tax=Candidatus Daviesbacteria bacterium RIFCSPHIGHO2_02_FULL_43_12 TaxID=1797776 RepID=A0A1F5KJ69_9BACT|nr:MAG: hypothetical protein A2631_06075 [Candidatus Daviesbacteria bacterium RIFCSPHIGHO2_01_FULL_44_29]OGE39160.1 MAG: hypothetical protein A3E86_03410 [Candidatus Daviesbacteria bacterium RIFCSPHIGHO2_12_FULL_47_45]OGE40963.1 MAG: hypothetical protein A3D25_02905 [Candidatus Daviesbacteria bacterium RIFCSPHIGHO2_02_FULL_43_12]OGE69886.1 MAG: hypothetical protein A3B55_05765 [Candidatus Daviesbacteria bacterium RIFCSPLOWO2_01_FULL_43_15]
MVDQAPRTIDFLTNHTVVVPPRKYGGLRPPFHPGSWTLDGLGPDERKLLEPLIRPYTDAMRAIAGRTKDYDLIALEERVRTILDAADRTRQLLPRFLTKCKLGRLEHETCSPGIGVVMTLKHCAMAAAELRGISLREYLHPRNPRTRRAIKI